MFKITLQQLQRTPCTTVSPMQRRNVKVTAVASPPAPSVRIQRVDDFMTKGALTVTPETSIDDALEMIVQHRISGFPVVDPVTNAVVGVVSDFDLLAIGNVTEEDSSGMFPTASGDWNTFFEVQKMIEKNEGKIVKDVMTPDAVCVRPSTSIHDAAHLLLTMKIRRLPVVDEQKRVLGVISRGNVIRAALEARKSRPSS